MPLFCCPSAARAPYSMLATHAQLPCTRTCFAWSLSSHCPWIARRDDSRVGVVQVRGAVHTARYTPPARTVTRAGGTRSLYCTGSRQVRSEQGGSPGAVHLSHRQRHVGPGVGGVRSHWRHFRRLSEECLFSFVLLLFSQFHSRLDVRGPVPGSLPTKLHAPRSLHTRPAHVRCRPPT